MPVVFNNFQYATYALWLIAAAGIVWRGISVYRAKHTERSAKQYFWTKAGDPYYSTQERWTRIGTAFAIAVACLGVGSGLGTVASLSNSATSSGPATAAETAQQLGFTEGLQYPLLAGYTIGSTSVNIDGSPSQDTPASALLVDFRPNGHPAAMLELPTAKTKKVIVRDYEPETFSVSFQDTYVREGDYYANRTTHCQMALYNLMFFWCKQTGTSIELSGEVTESGLGTLMQRYASGVQLRLHQSTNDRIYGFGKGIPRCGSSSSGN